MQSIFYQFILALCYACEFFDLSCNQTHGILSLSSFEIKNNSFQINFKTRLKNSNCGNSSAYFDSNFTGVYVSKTRSLTVKLNLTDNCKLSSMMEFEFASCFQDNKRKKSVSWMKVSVFRKFYWLFGSIFWIRRFIRSSHDSWSSRTCLRGPQLWELYPSRRCSFQPNR